MSLVAAPMAIVDLGANCKEEEAPEVSSYRHSSILMKGVRHLSDSGITRLPDSYVLPAPDRPQLAAVASSSRVKLPVVDLTTLRDPSRRAAALETLDAGCRNYGSFLAYLAAADGKDKTFLQSRMLHQPPSPIAT